jgi:hypothetical protein
MKFIELKDMTEMSIFVNLEMVEMIVPYADNQSMLLFKENGRVIVKTPYHDLLQVVINLHKNTQP